MVKNYFFRVLAIFTGIVFFTVPISCVSTEKHIGAKAIFHSKDREPTMVEPQKPPEITKKDSTPSSKNNQKAETKQDDSRNIKKPVPRSSKPTVKEKYTGISYKLLSVKNNGRMEVVKKFRAFKTGERIRIEVQTNRSGYLTVFNIGPTGNTNLLSSNQHVEGFNPHIIPVKTNMVFEGEPGEEQIIIILTDNQDFFGAKTTVQNTSRYFLQTASFGGVKDIFREDILETRIAVLSPKGIPEEKSSKDIKLESDQGANYSTVRSSEVKGGKALSLAIKLTHRK